jgi:hypothetical protein
MVAPNQPTSEFGRGPIVCLAKFSAHLENDHFCRALHCERWRSMSAEERKKIVAESKTHPHGDSARLYSDVICSLDAPDAGVSSAIEMWMNCASDHFYDLDHSLAPPSLRELAALALRIGHGFTGEIWTWSTVGEIQRLWRESCLALDAHLGIQADWGQF